MKKITISVIVALCLPIIFYGQTDGNFLCHRPLVRTVCNFIPNPQFRELDAAIIDGDFNQNNIPGWHDSQKDHEIKSFIKL